MTHIEQAIKEAELNGWQRPGRQLYLYEVAFLNPSFWQALGKARGWEDDDEKHWFASLNFPSAYVAQMLRFTRDIAYGGDAESFFAGL